MDIGEIGGKGASLVWLAQNTDLGFKVPEFEIIDTSYYKDFLRQPLLAQLVAQIHNFHNPGDDLIGIYTKAPKRLEERCIELADKFKGRAVSIRSSAVLSEDNEKLSGAGIYDTFFISKEELNARTLTNAVLKVYDSVNTARAIQYRKDAGLDEERMAVVVQELCSLFEYDSGVMQSRLQAVPKVIPISWAQKIGAVVNGDFGEDIRTVFFKERSEKSYTSDYRIIFESDNMHPYVSDRVVKVMKPVIEGLRKRYGREFEAEFSANFENGEVYMLQIRPLTNVTDKKIKFPKKKPIFTTGLAGLCMGVGEYIGPWVTRDKVHQGWEEPEHYALVAGELPKTMFKVAQELIAIGITQQGEYLDYFVLTPNKRAMVITHRLHHGSHALTIANEKGILCIGRYQEDYKNHFKVPLNKVGPYIHIVSDGLVGKVYKATEQEARNFARKNSPK